MSSLADAAAFASVRLVAVGSTNPVKLAAARAVIGRVAAGARVESVKVSSTVSDQPFGDEETIRGAVARARRARAELEGELGIGLEGGVVDVNGSMRTCAWAAVVDRAGREGVGGSLAMPLPDAVARLIRDEGLELGVAMDPNRRAQREAPPGRGWNSDGRARRPAGGVRGDSDLRPGAIPHARALVAVRQRTKTRIRHRRERRVRPPDRRAIQSSPRRRARLRCRGESLGWEPRGRRENP